MNTLFRLIGFTPFIGVIFLNAFVDLGHKIVIQNTVFKVYDGQTQIILTAIVNALILLPFILLFSPAGFLSDRYAKHRVMRATALAAVVATLLITVCYYLGWFWPAFGLTLALAVQSALYSPAKYGYIRELVGDDDLAAANGVVQATTIVSILAGTFVFSALFEYLLRQASWQDTNSLLGYLGPLGWLLVGLSLLELAVAWAVPDRSHPDTARTFDWRDYARGRYLQGNLHRIVARRPIWQAIIGLSMFWAIAQVVLAAFPAHAKATLGETNTLVIQGLLACSGIGIVLGSLLAGRLSQRHIELGLVPVGAAGIALSLAVIPGLDSAASLALAFVALGTLGGVFIIPLNALIQYHAGEKELGTVLAGNNWVQNIVMLLFLSLTVAFAVAGLNGRNLFALLLVVAAAGTVYTIWQLPHSLARILLSAMIRGQYKVDVAGFEYLPKQGGVLLLGNHVSWIDWAIVQVACPRPVRFVMLRSIYDRWYLKPFLKWFGAIPISSGQSREALRAVRERLEAGEVVCLFPEGAISRTGHLGKFYSGYERAVSELETPEGRGTVIVPFYLRGLWGSRFSRSYSEKLRRNTARGLQRDIIVAFGAPLPLNTSADALKQKVFELSISAWDSYSDTLDPLPLAWFRSARRHLGGTGVMDSHGTALRNDRLMAATAVMARVFRRLSPEPRVGLLLPASSAGLLANMAVMLNGQTAVNLNYTASVASVQAGLKNAGVRTVYSSDKFLRKLEGRGIDVDAMLDGVTVVPLETVRAGLPRWRLALALVAAWVLPAALFYRAFGRAVSLDDPAAILFSSGSEGVPKGIVLSHRNFLANIKQISEVLNTQEDDVVMGCLPPFHSFGLTVTGLLPLVEGLPVVCHPDPTDALGIAKAIARHQATILCGTATFLRLYARNRRIDPLMLDSLRVVVAGAEKLTPDVREAFQSRFNKIVYEGYGATETTPVASVNMPDRLDTATWRVQRGHRPGTVGLPVPGTSFRVVDPDTLETLPTGEDGLVLIAGTQVMLGYLNDPEKTREAIVELDGRRWYKTGDKGHLDEDGFLTLVDRYSRFAKVGGEMVSLGAVENAVAEALEQPDLEAVAVAVPDAKKGERVVLLSASPVDTESLRAAMTRAGYNPLTIPSACYRVEAVPKLGSGKTDFAAARRLALARVEDASA